MKRRGLWVLVGYLLILLGFTSLFLQLVGVQWAFLVFLEWGGRLVAFLLKIFMVLAGIIIVVLANTDWEKERKESIEEGIN